MGRLLWERGDMRSSCMLRSAAILVGLSVVTACAGAGGDPTIEPITAVGADGQTGARPERDAGADERAGDGSSGDAEVVPGDPADAELSGSPVAVEAGVDADADVGAGVDVTSVPDTITPAYVEAVLAELEALYAGALASHVAAGEPTLETTTKLGSAFAEPAYDGRLQHFIRIGEEGFVEIADADRIRPRTHTDVRLLVVAEHCVYAETRLDVSPVREDPRPVVASFVHLGPRDREIFDDVNPTPWLIHRMPGGDPAVLRELDPCAA